MADSYSCMILVVIGSVYFNMLSVQEKSFCCIEPKCSYAKPALDDVNLFST